MEMNHQKLTDTIWELGVAMEDQNLHDQIPFDHPLWQNFPLQTSHHHEIASSSSTQLPISGALENPIEIRGEGEEEEEDEQDEELGAMKEMMYKIAAMQPVDIDPATVRKPKRRNVRISDDPQSVAARHRRERISEKIRILQRLVPGGTKMDTASMLDEAVRYVKFLKRQIRLLQQQPNNSNHHHHHHVATTDWPYTANKAVLPATPPQPERTGFSYGYGGSGDPTNMRIG